MFRLSTVIGKAAPTMPIKINPYKPYLQTSHSRPRCSYSRQARLINQPRCTPRNCPTPMFKLWCRFLKAAQYVALTMVGATAVTGGFVAYAKSDPELRDWLTIMVPTLDEVIAIATQENMTYSEFIDLTKKYFGFDGPSDKSNPSLDVKSGKLNNVESH